MSGSLVGLDVGGGSIKAVCMRAGAVVGETVSDTYQRPDGETLRSAFAQVIERLEPAPDAAVGLCSPGIFSADRTRVEVAVNLPGLVGMDLEIEVRRLLPACARVWLVSDAHASAYGYWARERRPGRLLALVVGTGVGACVLDEGAPLEVVDGCPGHIGQVDVGPIGGGEGPVGPDGGRGSLEGYVGSPALTRRFGEDRVGGLLGAPDDDPAFIALARAIRICHAIYRPDEVALLGGVGTRLQPRTETLRGLIDRELTSVAREGWSLRFGASDRYGAEGAALLAEAAGP